MKKVIILIGAPGSGKGTQSSIIKEHYNIAHISTGDLFRNEIKQGTEIGLKVKSLLAEGKLVDNKTTTDLLDKRLQQEDCQNGFILDGYPRGLEQAELLQELFDKYGIEEYKVIEIKLEDQVLIKRITGRYSCTKCGAIYNEYFKSPKEYGVCDICDSKEFSKRNDDNIDTLKQRLEIYYHKTNPILKWYESKGVVSVIDGKLNIADSKLKLIEIIN